MAKFDVFVEGTVRIRYRLEADHGGLATPVATDKFAKHFGAGSKVERVYFEEVSAEQLEKEEATAKAAAQTSQTVGT